MIRFWLALGLFPALLHAETVVPPPASSGVPHPGLSPTSPPPAANPSTPQPEPPGKEVEVGPPRPDPDRILPAIISPEARIRARALALYAEALRIENQSRDPAAALPTFLEIAQLDPLFVKAHLQIAYYYFRLRQYQDAIDHLQEALENNPGSGELKSAAARAYFLMGRHEEAEAVAREALAAEPGNLNAYRALIEVFAREERPDAIQELAKQGLSHQEGDGDFFLQLGDLSHRGLIDAGLSDQTELAQILQPVYEKAREKGHESERLFSVLAECAAKLGQRKLAVEYARAAIAQAPDNELLHRRLAAYLVQDGDDQAALKAARQAWELAPDDQAAWRMLVKLHLKLNQQDEAVDVLLRVIEYAPQHDPAYSMLATLYAEMKDPAKAADTLIKAARRFPRNVQLALLCSVLLRDQERYQDGIELLERAVRSNPTQARLYLSLADLYEQAGQNAQAQANFQQALSLEPGALQNHLLLAMSQARVEDYAAAAATLAEARRRFPTSAAVAIREAWIARRQERFTEALASLAQFEAITIQQTGGVLPEDFYLEKGVTLELMENYRDAEATMRAGLAAHPQSHQIQNALAYHWAERGTNLPEALAMSKASLDAMPKKGEYLDTLGWIYFKLGNFKEALPLLQNAALATRNDPVVLDHLAQTFLQLGRQDKAIELWQQILKDDPEDENLPPNADVQKQLDALGVKD